jgi:hypothetical protein
VRIKPDKTKKKETPWVKAPHPRGRFAIPGKSLEWSKTIIEAAKNLREVNAAIF